MIVVRIMPLCFVYTFAQWHSQTRAYYGLCLPSNFQALPSPAQQMSHDPTMNQTGGKFMTCLAMPALHVMYAYLIYQ